MNTLTRTRRRDLFAGRLAWLCALLIAAAACATVAAGEARTQESSGYSQDALTMLGLVNDYRAENGLGPVALDDTLTTAARRHSEDQVKYDFFDHSTVESDYYAPGSGPYERATQEGYPAENAVGENIAYGYGSVERTFEGWVNSPSHNANLLNPDWQVMGLGYAPGGDMWTQAFGSGITSATQEKPARSEASSGEAAPSEAAPSKAAPNKAPSEEGTPSEYDAGGTPSEDEEASGEGSSGSENVTEEGGGSIVCQNGSCQQMQSGESISSTPTGASVTQREQQSNENVQTQSYEGSGIVYRLQEHETVQRSSTGGERTDGTTTGSPTSGEETEDEAEEADAGQRDAERDTEKPDDERATEGDDGGSAPTTSPIESGPVAKESGSGAEDNVTVVNGKGAPGGASGVAGGTEAGQVMKKAKATADKAMAAVDKAMKKAKEATSRTEQEKKEAEEEAEEQANEIIENAGEVSTD